MKPTHYLVPIKDVEEALKLYEDALLHREKQYEQGKQEAYREMRGYPKVDIKKHNKDIQVLIKSCEEGRDGDWDCSTDEGKEGFDDMITLLEKCVI